MTCKHPNLTPVESLLGDKVAHLCLDCDAQVDLAVDVCPRCANPSLGGDLCGWCDQHEYAVNRQAADREAEERAAEDGWPL